jgi:hypothetical protein
MPPPLNFYSSYSKGTIKDARFYYSYNIRFNTSGSSASKLEALIAIRSTYPTNNTSANPSDVPIALKSINLTIAVTVPTERHLTYARLLRALCIRLSFSPFFLYIASSSPFTPLVPYL